MAFVAAAVVAGSVTVIVAVPAFTPVTVTVSLFVIATVATEVSDDATVKPDGRVAAPAAASVADTR